MAEHGSSDSETGGTAEPGRSAPPVGDEVTWTAPPRPAPAGGSWAMPSNPPAAPQQPAPMTPSYAVPAAPPVAPPSGPPAAPPHLPLAEAAPVAHARFAPNVTPQAGPAAMGGAPPAWTPPGGMTSPTPMTPSNGPAPRRRGGLAMVVVAALIAGLLGSAMTALLLRGNGTGEEAGRAALELDGEGLDIRGVLEKVSPSVVSIRTGSGLQDAAGTGVILDANGLILTNHHVIGSASTIEVTFSDQSRHVARLVGSVPDEDIALIQAQDVTGATPAEIGSSSDLQVGDEVVAIGNALGLGDRPTVTRGIVSALNRNVTAEGGLRLRGLVQTDAAINPGNSGGPLVDALGRVVGVNTVVAARAQNIGFALGIDTVMPVVEDLKAGRSGAGRRALLGVTTLPVAQVAPEVAVRFRIETTTGAFVQDVAPGSGAAEAGLQPGDVITGIDGTEVRTPQEVGDAVAAKEPGEEMEITWWHLGEERTGTATLGSR